VLFCGEREEGMGMHRVVVLFLHFSFICANPSNRMIIDRLFEIEEYGPLILILP